MSGGVRFDIGFLIDPLSALMMLVVTFVSLMVHIYTIGYMADDPGYQRFFSYIALFTFSMLMLVMANNFLQLFFGWEAVGLVSYLLIGFWYTRPTAIYANLKAFLVNRVGDFGFLLGIAMPRGLFASELRRQLEPFAVLVLLPMFFTFSGLNTRLDLEPAPDTRHLKPQYDEPFQPVDEVLVSRCQGIYDKARKALGPDLGGHSLLDLLAKNCSIARKVSSCTTVSGLISRMNRPRALARARLFARAKPRFSPLSITWTAGKHSRTIAALPSSEALSTTKSSPSIPAIALVMDVRAFSRKERTL